LESWNDLYPHSPWEAVSFRYKDTVTDTVVVLTTLMMVSLPCCGASTLVAHGSPPVLLLTGAVVDVNVTLRVGKDNGVLDGSGVWVGVSVGGSGVAVGTAAWVSAIMVMAAATAVFCTSTAFIVGGGGSAPQALTSKVVKRMTVRKERRFMLCEYLLVKLAIGVASTAGLDAVVPYDNRPVALGDAETAECFEVLSSGDKCSGAVVSDRSREAVAGNDEIPALAEVRHHIHG
jgi:hypothetical protein